MKRLYIVGIVAFLAALTLGVFFEMSYSGMFALRYDTNKWAVIVDKEGSQMAVEPARTYTRIFLTTPKVGKEVFFAVFSNIIKNIKVGKNNWPRGFIQPTTTILGRRGIARTQTLLESQNILKFL